MKAQILEKIQQYDTIIIHRHVRPDPDAYGSQGGLAEMLRASFPEKNIYAVGQHEQELGFLFTPDVIADEVYEGALVIVCDTANQPRVCDQRYKTGDYVIKIDHHPNEDPYGDIIWVDTTAASTCELIYEFYAFGKDKGLKLTDEAARRIFAGIVSDTGRFLFPSTNQRTFDYAGELIRYSFDRSDLFDQMYELDPRIIKLQGYILEHFTIDNQGVAYFKLTKEILEQFDVTSSESSLLVNALRNVKGIKAWCYFIEEETEIRVRFRSKGPVINTLAMKYGGGGHPLAAGASIQHWEQAEEIIKELKQLV